MEILAWRDRGDGIRAIRARHLQHVEAAVAFWMALASRGGRTPAWGLAAQLRDLPAPSRLRLLEAPETYRRLVHPLTDLSREAVEFTAKALRAERCLLGKEPPLAQPVWTALGDAYFPAGPVKSPRERIGWDSSTASRAPSIVGGPVLDGVSPFCTIDTEAGLPPVRPHTARELAVIVRRVRDATRRIAGVRPGVLETIFQVTRVIVCRKTTVPEAGFASSSWPAYVGKVALVNAHCAEVTRERLANALIHEAIHSILFMIETSEPFVVDFTRAGDATVTSPWSGRALPLINYVHACFVWYGLWRFWRLATRAKTFAPASAASHLELAASGFRGPSLLTALAPLRSCVASAALDSIREAQETVVDN
jgi:hypothetical protein